MSDASLPPPDDAIADGRWRRLDPNHVQVQRLAGWLFAGPVMLGSLIGITTWSLALDGLWWFAPLAGWVVAAGLLAWWTQVWPGLAYRYASYAVDAAGIEMRDGVVFRQVLNVPRSRVQHTDVSQGPIERHFGLGTLVIYTAGTSHARVSWPGLPHGTALLIRDHLLGARGDDAV